MKKGLILLVFVLFLIGCTKVENVNLTMTSSKIINDTLVVRNDTYNLEEEQEELPMEVKEGLCTEKVLLALRECRWSDENLSNIELHIKNNGFKNVTMAFYFYDGDQVGSMFNDTNLAEKQELVYTIPIKELEDVHGEITKIHATPILTENGDSISCSNKKLPVLISGCNY